jgi:hypothetical protein
MGVGMRFGRLSVAVLAAAWTALGAQATASSCDNGNDCCVQADAWVTWASGAPDTNLTPWQRGHCVVEGPHDWAPFLDPGAEDREGWVSPPLPSGGGVSSSIPTG